jgi:DNA-directed RNA polymerase subunit RPC12/RpoP
MIDKPKVNLECSACAAPLAILIIAKPTEEETKVVAECPYCGDKSFKKTIKGRIVYCSTEYVIATPFPVHAPRQYLDDPIVYTGEVIVKTEIIKKWRGK